ncbi:SAM-dependent methyltransferase [Brevibacterium aurantiacum]|uniref:SAM-dependent methyltransferase n=2 Tax=Brevibacterium aurantiacum TaxID=273384 RepID=A0A2A3ZGY6_BREAU|nr:SAM-dependent methyltransferase [Brevibacterium aurantiacum]
MEMPIDDKAYAAKMRGFVDSGTDLEVDVRFIDMIVDRESRVLDIGCGIGNAVNGLQARGHDAFGIDPSSEVLQVAGELYDPSWFRLMSATKISAESLADEGLPQLYDVVLMSGNVPAFLPELGDVFKRIGEVLRPGGILIIGTTTHVQGGPSDQDSACEASALRLNQRFGDWHLGQFDETSPWSVSVFSKPGPRSAPVSPDGMFVLPSPPH